MKKLVLLLAILSTTLNSYSQTCEERENKLLEVFGGFSAGMLYNTYGVIGSISDGFAHEAYDALTVSDLMDAQKKVADNMVNMLEGLKSGGFLKDIKDQNYIASVIIILQGLKKQAQILDEYVNNKSRQKMEEYAEQRKQNWSAISKLMGIAE
jgi:hypothetical protein